MSEEEKRRLSYGEFLKKTETAEKCPICGNYYYNHIGTGREYICLKNNLESKI